MRQLILTDPKLFEQFWNAFCEDEKLSQLSGQFLLVGNLVEYGVPLRKMQLLLDKSLFQIQMDMEHIGITLRSANPSRIRTLTFILENDDKFGARPHMQIDGIQGRRVSALIKHHKISSIAESGNFII